MFRETRRLKLKKAPISWTSSRLALQNQNFGNFGYLSTQHFFVLSFLTCKLDESNDIGVTVVCCAECRTKQRETSASSSIETRPRSSARRRSTRCRAVITATVTDQNDKTYEVKIVDGVMTVDGGVIEAQMFKGVLSFIFPTSMGD